MSNCSKCGTVNRSIAKFCKKCGTSLVQKQIVTSREGYYGKECIEDELNRFQNRTEHYSELRNKKDSDFRIGFDSLIMGPSGSGKSFITKELIKFVTDAKIIDSSKIVEIYAIEFRNWSGSLDSKLSEISDGILIINNIHKILGDSGTSQVTDLDPLFERMSSSTSRLPIIIMTGLSSNLEGYFSKNPGVASLFEFRFRLRDMDTDSLAKLTAEILKENFSMFVQPDALQKLKGRYEWLLRRGGGTSGNGHLAVATAEDLATSKIDNGKSRLLLAEDIKGEIFVPLTEDEILSELNKFVGLANFKAEIENLIGALNKARKEKGPDARITVKDHYIFTGNPGTGKTTIARKFAEILSAVGALPKGQFIETDPSKLIGQYIGDTEKNVRDIVDLAMGGVLLIDEAYGLSNSKFGESAINTLVPLLENNKGQFVCIVAGYKREMGDFLKKNTGLKSRFNKSIDFEDYNPAELEQLFLINARNNGYSLTDEAMENLHIPMEQMYNRRTELFGNGREVRNFFDAAVDRMNKRIGSSYSEENVLTYEDIVGEENTKQININEILSELDELVGLSEVKEQLKILAGSIIQEKKRALRKGGSPKIPEDHYMFLGNPGTGKTTVARMMGKILKSLGILSTDEVIEVAREDLIDSCVGGTAPKTKDAVMRAMGGILFIDEAYSLYNGDNDTYGHECISTLLKLVLDNKGKFVCIVAGYTKEMSEFVASNSGLRSRFTKKLFFEDYNPEQLMEIFIRIVKKYDFRLDYNAEQLAFNIFKEMYNQRDANFGNAREVGNYFEEVRNCHNVRLLKYENTTEEQDYTITIEDIETAYARMKRMTL